MLLGLLRPHAGTVGVLGLDPRRDAVDLHRRPAYVPGEVSLRPNLTGGEVIDLLAALRGRTDRARRHALVERFGLDPIRRGRQYSKGNRQKVALVAAPAADVELLLDEPTAGLDPLADAEFRRALAEERDRGRTVLLSSHLLPEVESLCDRVTLIRSGWTVETGTLAELRHLTRTAVTAELTGPVPALADLPGIHGLEVDGRRLRCEVEPAAMPEVVRRLGAVGVVSLASRPPSLEQVFLDHYAAAGSRS
ncbi:ABC transporter ATP-binding protein [Pseudonocardia xishanensis]|uniref:ABC transporter ATP-binding protein n=1 Tax=Pseudonocardia xishanensis TaxID=630995 RepID=A0ABP8RLK2_9PSEU